MPSRVELFSDQAGAWWLGLKVAEAGDGVTKIDTVIFVKGNDASAKAVISAQFPQKIVIQDDLLDKSADPPKLKSPDALTGEARLRLNELVRRLHTQEIVWDNTDERTFLAAPGGFSADGKFEGDARLMLSNLALPAKPNAVIAEFAVRAVLKVSAADKNSNAIQAFRSFAVILVVRQSAVPKLRLDFDDLNIALPEIDFPDLDLSALKRLKLPSVGADLARMFKNICGDVTVALTTTAADPHLVVGPQNGRLALALREDATDAAKFASFKLTAT